MAPLSSTRSATRDSSTSARLRSKRRRVQRSSLRAAYRWSQLDPCRICPRRCRYTPKGRAEKMLAGAVFWERQRMSKASERRKDRKKRRILIEHHPNTSQKAEKRPDLFGERPSNGNVRQKRFFRKNYRKPG